jgi:hypothetical protein
MLGCRGTEAEAQHATGVDLLIGLSPAEAIRQHASKNGVAINIVVL